MPFDTRFDRKIKYLIDIPKWDQNWRVVQKQVHEVPIWCQQTCHIKCKIIANQVSQASMTSQALKQLLFYHPLGNRKQIWNFYITLSNCKHAYVSIFAWWLQNGITHQSQMINDIAVKNCNFLG